MKQIKYPLTEIDITELENLPLDTKERLHHMELSASKGIKTWIIYKSYSESSVSHGLEALDLLGYYELRKEYGNYNKCKHCNIILRYTQDRKVCDTCTKPKLPRRKECTHCNTDLTKDKWHNYKTFGECCTSCSGHFTQLCKELQPYEHNPAMKKEVRAVYDSYFAEMRESNNKLINK